MNTNSSGPSVLGSCASGELSPDFGEYARNVPPVAGKGAVRQNPGDLGQHARAGMIFGSAVENEEPSP